MARRSKEELSQDWVLSGKDHVSGRMVFFFDLKGSNGEKQIRIAVSNTFRDPEEQAWAYLDELVK